MAFFESAVSVLETLMVALEAGLEAMDEMNAKGKLCKGFIQCHAIVSYNNLGIKALIPKMMKPPPKKECFIMLEYRETCGFWRKNGERKILL